MGYDKAELKNNIEALWDLLVGEKDEAAAKEKFAIGLSNAIDTFAKTGVVSTNVSVDPGTHTGTGTGNVS